jgi:hypothetical protein
MKWITVITILFSVTTSYSADVAAPNCDQPLRQVLPGTVLAKELNILTQAGNSVMIDPAKNIQLIGIYLQFKTFSQLIVDKDGDFYAFRKLGGPFDPAKKGTYSNLEGHWSYSMNPYITVLWDGGGPNPIDTTKSHIVISRLKFVDEKKEFSYPTFSRNAADAFGIAAPSNQIYRPLNADSPLSDDAFYDEIDVPFASDNPIADIPESDYRQILLNISKASRLNSGGSAFSLTGLLQKVLKHPNTKLLTQ